MARLDKKERFGKFIKISVIILIIAIILLAGYFVLFKNSKNRNNSPNLQNPLNSIISANTFNGKVNQSAIIAEGIKEFNESYINYLLSSLGVSKLHKSALGYGNPKLELLIDLETWNSELGDAFRTEKRGSDDPDIRIRITREDAVKALLSSDIKQYMKDSIASKKVSLEMVAGKIELLSKGYLDLSSGLGYEINL